jgi:soluble lytic murein transglycosylase
MQYNQTAIASYNAGERTVMGWARRRAGWDLDAFVEAISIAETRRYTRRVLRSYATYRYLYGAGDERFLILPEKVAIGAN